MNVTVDSFTTLIVAPAIVGPVVWFSKTVLWS